MEKVTIEACGKLNLCLSIDGKREDGYHLISSVFQSIDLKNELTIEEHDGFLFTCDDKNLPTDESNTVVKAVKKFCEKTGAEPNVKITLSKRIPYGAGMGSASADAAAALKLMNIAYPDLLSREETLEIAKKVGADVPFSYIGGTAFVTGIGEKIEPLKPLSGCAFLIVKPSYSVSTKEAYQLVDSALKHDICCNEVLSAIETSNIEKLSEYIDNDFYYCLNYQKNKEIKALMIENGAMNATLTGSGSALFGIFKDHREAMKAKEKIPGSMVACPTERALYIK